MLLSALVLSACSIATDLDRFEVVAPDGGSDADVAADTGTADAGPQPPACGDGRTLCLELRGFNAHPEDRVEARIVSDQGILRMRAILDPFGRAAGDADETLVVPLAIPARGGPHSLQLWADRNQNDTYDPPDSDHSWLLDIPDDGTLRFTHDNVWVTLDEPTPAGENFRIRMTGMGLHAGQMLDLVVIDELTGRTVGFYRMQRLPGDGVVDIEIPGIVEPGTTYDVEFFADDNDNQRFDGKPLDHTWRLPQREAGLDGLDLEFDHRSPFDELEYFGIDF